MELVDTYTNLRAKIIGKYCYYASISNSQFNVFREHITMTNLTSLNIDNYQRKSYYHALISRQKAESYLQAYGDFLIRDSGDKCYHVVSVKDDCGHFKHIKFSKAEDKFEMLIDVRNAFYTKKAIETWDDCKYVLKRPILDNGVPL